MPDSLSAVVDSLRQSLADSISQSIYDSLAQIEHSIETPPVEASVDWYYVFTLLGIMIGTGLLGGAANYLNSPQEERNLMRSLLMGLVATIAIPLFLKVVDSNILNDTKGDILNYFIYAGCCVVAAFYSARFLEGLSSRIIQNLEKKVEQTNQAVQENAEKLNETAEKTDMIMDTQIPDPANVDPGPVPELAPVDLKTKGISRDIEEDNLSMQERIVACFATYPLQKIESISKASGISPANLRATLMAMEQEGKIKKVIHRGEEVFSLKK